MASVYGLKQAADAGVGETWMDRFTRSEPEGGFGAVVRQAWSHDVRTPIETSRLGSMNGLMQSRPVYGLKVLPAGEAAAGTWMDRFTKLEPEDGFRATVVRAWSSKADKRMESLAA
jgi:hypothetical protein